MVINSKESRLKNVKAMMFFFSIFFFLNFLCVGIYIEMQEQDWQIFPPYGKWKGDLNLSSPY